MLGISFSSIYFANIVLVNSQSPNVSTTNTCHWNTIRNSELSKNKTGRPCFHKSSFWNSTSSTKKMSPQDTFWKIKLVRERHSFMIIFKRYFSPFIGFENPPRLLCTYRLSSWAISYSLNLKIKTSEHFNCTDIIFVFFCNKTTEWLVWDSIKMLKTEAISTLKWNRNIIFRY